VLTWVEQSLRSSAHSVERITLIQHTIGPCRECGECRKTDNPDLCHAPADDVNAIINKMIRADAIIIATPLFCWGFPSHLKALLDRLYCVVGDYAHNPEYATKLEGKPIGLLVTCGGAEEGNAELVIRAYYAMVRFLKAVPAGHLLYPFFRTPHDLTQQDRNRATEFALHVAAEGNL
jgi:multimeric flavodoxin WrbA